MTRCVAICWQRCLNYKPLGIIRDQPLKRKLRLIFPNKYINGMIIPMSTGQNRIAEERRCWERLFNRRRELGLSQKQISENIGVQQPVYAKWERLRQVPTRRRVLQLSEALHLSIEDLESDIRGYFIPESVDNIA